MKAIKRNLRVFVSKERYQIMVRVRWNNKKNEVGFTTGLYAEPEKWKADTQRARNNTTHHVNNFTMLARDINRHIDEFVEVVEDVFSVFELRGVSPTNDELRNKVNEQLGRNQQEVENNLPKRELTYDEAWDEFMRQRPVDMMWGDKCHYKYNQLRDHIKSFDPHLSFATLDKRKMLGLKEWYITNGYHNATIVKRICNFKGFLRWVDTNGYATVRKDALGFQINMSSPQKTVTFLKHQELLDFAAFEFPTNKQYLERVRDFFVFMSSTSLRYSDLKALRWANISNGCIDFYTQKTKDKLHIPLNDLAISIIEKYKGQSDGLVFPVPSNQKMNSYLKEAAKLAGLDREIETTVYIGATRVDKVQKLHELISCHMARRTFVVCSISFGIPPTVVMSCTGHSDYDSMKPYINVADETRQTEMNRWNRVELKNKVQGMIGNLSLEKLHEVEDFLLKI